MYELISKQIKQVTNTLAINYSTNLTMSKNG